mmetsp:Transcript_15231/g.29356  ORF Transcript_15231/g.29356 Transcript_15231/m.29356 type:complete len:101 (+) Transcript_15231:716-1018(+)
MPPEGVGDLAKDPMPRGKRATNSMDSEVAKSLRSRTTPRQRLTCRISELRDLGVVAGVEEVGEAEAEGVHEEVAVVEVEVVRSDLARSVARPCAQATRRH